MSHTKATKKMSIDSICTATTNYHATICSKKGSGLVQKKWSCFRPAPNPKQSSPITRIQTESRAVQGREESKLLRSSVITTKVKTNTRWTARPGTKITRYWQSSTTTQAKVHSKQATLILLQDDYCLYIQDPFYHSVNRLVWLVSCSHFS